MKGYLAVAKYVITLLLYGAYLVFAFRINEQIKSATDSISRASLISLSIVGVYFLIGKVMERWKIAGG